GLHLAQLLRAHFPIQGADRWKRQPRSWKSVEWMCSLKNRITSIKPSRGEWSEIGRSIQPYLPVFDSHRRVLFGEVGEPFVDHRLHFHLEAVGHHLADLAFPVLLALEPWIREDLLGPLDVRIGEPALHIIRKAAELV